MSKAATARTPHSPPLRKSTLLQYYEAIEQASLDMLEAARVGNWDRVVKLEGACAVLISQLKHAAGQDRLPSEEMQMKSRIMQRILAGQGVKADLDSLRSIPAGIMGNTICALGDAASMPVVGFVKKFGDEFEYFIEHGRSMHDGRLVV